MSLKEFINRYRKRKINANKSNKYTYSKVEDRKVGPNFSEEEYDENEEKEENTEEYEVVEREILPAKIICPDCGGITLEGLEFCDKCGGELQ